MKKVLLIIYAGKETHEGMGRVFNALIAAKELKEAKHDVSLIFDGAGTEWLADIMQESSQMHQLYQTLKDNISAACDFCAGAFKVKEQLQAQKAPLVGQYEGHPSFRKYVEEGYQIVTF